MSREHVLPNGRKVNIWASQIDDNTINQIEKMAVVPVVPPSHAIAIMADAHCGIGAVVGSVVPTTGGIIPSAVGVDIGCGMSAIASEYVRADFNGIERELRKAIEKKVPVGFREHPTNAYPPEADEFVEEFQTTKFYAAITQGMRAKLISKIKQQMGTLGGGNHFIEICLEEATDTIWIMLHSGSRYLGHTIGSYYIDRAQMTNPEIARYGDLAWLEEGSQDFEAYWEAKQFAQKYAAKNREVMVRLVIAALEETTNKKMVADEIINIHHNYSELETVEGGDKVYITRKGAIHVPKGRLGIIPCAMGKPSYIVRGLGNPLAYDSSSHGAGRKLSRTQARAAFNTTDLEKQTAGVECRKDKGVIDEIPSAYKDMGTVMDDQRDLCEIVHTIKAIVCVKG